MARLPLQENERGGFCTRHPRGWIKADGECYVCWLERCFMGAENANSDLASKLAETATERDRFRLVLEQIRDGIFSGNHAAAWAREALDG